MFCYMDDILVTGPTDEAHRDNLETAVATAKSWS